MQQQLSESFINELYEYITDQEMILQRINQFMSDLEIEAGVMEENIKEMKKLYEAETGYKNLTKPNIKRIK